MLVEEQVTYLKETMWSQDTLFSALTDSLGRVSSSGKPATKKRTSHT
jgi:hypothetical protein